MLNIDTGITTNAGIDLLNRINRGNTKIRYTKIVFSSLDLSSASVDDIKNLTDISPQELVAIPEVVLKPKTDTSNQETEIQATVTNKSLSSGFFVNTYGIYAEDDDDNKILYGVAVDNHPSYLPAFDNVREQQLTYEWDSAITDASDVHFTDTHDAYVTRFDFNRDISRINSNQGNLASTVASNGSMATSAMSNNRSYTTSAVSCNTKRIDAAMNRLNEDYRATNASVDQVKGTASSAVNTAGQAESNAGTFASSVNANLAKSFNALLVAFNQVGAENVNLRAKLLK